MTSAEYVIRIDQAQITAPNFPRSTEWWRRFLPTWFTHQQWWKAPNDAELVNSAIVVANSDLLIAIGPTQNEEQIMKYLTTGVLAKYIPEAAITVDRGAEYRATIGTVTPRGKAHLAHGSRVQRILCGPGNRAPQTTATLAVCDPDGDVCDALLNAEIPIARLCAKCFPIRTRTRYSAHIKTAIVARREGEPAAPCGHPNT